MKSCKKQCAEAKSIYAEGLRNVKTKPMPKGQKYAPGTRVRIADDLGPDMSHFTGGVNATVEYTYAHAFGGNDVEEYSLNVDGEGSVAWYQEWQLTPITNIPKRKLG